MRMFLLSGALLVSACATTGDVSQMADNDLCDAIDRPFRDSDAIAAELIERGRYKPNHLAELRAMDRVPIGASVCDLFIVHGRPDYSNATYTEQGQRVQYVYGDGLGYRFYVYLENARVVAAQY